MYSLSPHKHGDIMIHKSHIISCGYNPDLDVKQSKRKSKAMNAILSHKNISLFLHAHTMMDTRPVVSVVHVSGDGAPGQGKFVYFVLFYISRGERGVSGGDEGVGW